MTERARSLKETVRQADRVFVVSGPTYDARHRKGNEVLARETEQESIASLVVALDTVEGGYMDWTTTGDVSLVFLSGRQPLAVITCLLPGWVRSYEFWPGDARLRDPDLLTQWLMNRGIIDDRAVRAQNQRS